MGNTRAGHGHGCNSKRHNRIEVYIHHEHNMGGNHASSIQNDNKEETTDQLSNRLINT